MENKIWRHLVTLKLLEREAQRQLSNANLEMFQLVENFRYLTLNGGTEKEKMYLILLMLKTEAEILGYKTSVTELDHICNQVSDKHCGEHPLYSHPVRLLIDKSTDKIGKENTHAFTCLCLECQRLIDFDVHEVNMGEYFGTGLTIPCVPVYKDFIIDLYNIKREKYEATDHKVYKKIYEELLTDIPEAQINFGHTIIKTIPHSNFSGTGDRQTII